MRLGLRLRNLTECSRPAENLFGAINGLPGYRATAMRLARQRIEYVRQHRCYSLMIELSSVCNARCVFCPHSTMEREKRIMDDDLFDLIVSRIIAEKINPPIIDLFNVGEPLTDHKVFQRVRRLKAGFPAAKVCMVTNFALADAAIVDEVLASGLDSIQISLNATSGDTYRKIMKLDYDKTVRNLELLLEKRKATRHPLYVTLSFVLCDQNRGQERDFIRTWERKVDSVVIQRAVSWGGAIEVPSDYTAKPYPCNDLFERITMLSNGEVALCCQDHEGIVGVNVRDTPILTAFHSTLFQSMRDVHLDGDISSLDMCKDCFGVHSNGTNWMLKTIPAWSPR